MANRSEKIISELVSELGGVTSLHDLFDRQKALSVLFDELARVAIETKACQEASKQPYVLSEKAVTARQKLYEEFYRVLAIPGARAFLETCQGSGGERLARAFHQSASRPKGPPSK